MATSDVATVARHVIACHVIARLIIDTYPEPSRLQSCYAVGAPLL